MKIETNKAFLRFGMVFLGVAVTGILVLERQKEAIPDLGPHTTEVFVGSIGFFGILGFILFFQLGLFPHLLKFSKAHILSPTQIASLKHISFFELEDGDEA